MPDERGQPVLYLDTNVILDAIDGRRDATGALIEQIETHGWRAITCPFGFLELLEAKKADRWAEQMLSSGLTFWQVQRRTAERRTGRSALKKADLESVYTDLHERLSPLLLKSVVFPDMPTNVLDLAEKICGSTNIESTDSLHLATALHFGCDILITSDSDFLGLPKPYIFATTPEGFPKALKEYTRRPPAL